MVSQLDLAGRRPRKRGARFALAGAILATGVLAPGLVASSARAAVDPTILRCVFDSGSIRTLKDGAFQAAPAKPLTFDITNVNLAAQTAQIVTKGGVDDLRIVRAINANHYLEVVTEGFLNMTTVYEPMAGETRLPAAHSRHFGLLGDPVVTQYSGFCEIVAR